MQNQVVFESLLIVRKKMMENMLGSMIEGVIACKYWVVVYWLQTAIYILVFVFVFLFWGAITVLLSSLLFELTCCHLIFCESDLNQALLGLHWTPLMIIAVLIDVFVCVQLFYVTCLVIISWFKLFILKDSPFDWPLIEATGQAFKSKGIHSIWDGLGLGGAHLVKK